MSARQPTFEILISATVLSLLVLLAWMTVELHYGNPWAALLMGLILTAIARLFGTWTQIKFRK